MKVANTSDFKVISLLFRAKEKNAGDEKNEGGEGDGWL